MKSIDTLDLNGTYSYADYLKWEFEERLELIKGKIFKNVTCTCYPPSEKLQGCFLLKYGNCLNTEMARFLQLHLT